jgi:probable rRNA maturation factor
MIRLQRQEFPLPARGLPARLRRAAGRIGLAGEVTVRLAGAAEARALNREFRHIDRATDVLSFPAGADGGEYAGDILICMPVAEAQARRAGHSLARELLLLAIHGLLHLKGLDHETDRGEMLAAQRRLFAELVRGLP